MSHITGTVQVLGAPLVIKPGAPTIFNPPAAPGGTKLLVLHFQNLKFKAGDELHVELGYATDKFTAADGPSFWTRPVNVYAFPAGVKITYVAAGPATGSVELDQYGRGERHAGEVGHPSFSNCDPFYQDATYPEPKYDPTWYCADPPNWENVRAVPGAGDVRTRVASSVGMILSVEKGDAGVVQLSSCSVTLVDADKVITAGHCHQPSEALDSSVTFDYETLPDGSRPIGYSPRFYKVKAVLGHIDSGAAKLDYSLLQLAEAPDGIAPIQMRPDRPGVNEEVFGVHHPNGAVKKLSLPHGEGFAKVMTSSVDGIGVPKDFHVSGGSSGSGLFDTAGHLVGVCSRGAPCSPGGVLLYCPTPNILADLVPTPPPSVTRDVVLTLDRSGSMSSDDGTGRKKIDAARDAVALFVRLVTAATGNRVGLVSFSTTPSAPVDFPIAAVSETVKNHLVGLAPFAGGIVGNLKPGGATTIGGGLDASRLQFAMPGVNPRAILLLTDGLQNTPPDVGAVEAALAGIAVHAIGFGTESNLNGALLTSLTGAHGGKYMRAGGGLALEKFFSSAFGNIFESGVVFDPEFDLPADTFAGPEIPFDVCGEKTVTIVVGWDAPEADLLIEVTTPGGARIASSTAGLESATGRTWSFLRIPLAFGGERDGEWSVRVLRPRDGGEFPPPHPALRYFVNVVALGGPRMSLPPTSQRYYTGDRINPLVLVRHDDGGWPRDMQMTLTVSRPDTGVGNVVSRTALGPAAVIDGDAILPREAALQALEHASGKPVANYTETDFELSNATADTDGVFESGGTFGRPIEDLLTVEGNYTFHAKARYGLGCAGMRELVWSTHVEVGIDPGKTTVSTSPLPPGSSGGSCVRITFTPRDKYGNLLGPGRLDAFSLEPGSGTTISGAVIDLGGGSYGLDACSAPGSLDPPSVGVLQPGRPPVLVGPTDTKHYSYSVQFLCGEQGDDCCDCPPVRPGSYATAIAIHNPTAHDVPVRLRPIPLVLAGAPSGRAPRSNGPGQPTLIRIPAHAATITDCCRILEMLLGAQPAGRAGMSVGLLEIVSAVDLEVTAVYTAGHEGRGAVLEVERVQGRLLPA